jgi:two-component system, OmpR family, response regulator
VARVIVVDDAPEIRELLRGVLQLEGHTVVEVSGGAEAIALETSSKDVMILDVMMPRVDGWTVLAAMRDRGADCPNIIMLTAVTGELDRQRALSLGASGFVTKPFDVDDITSEIEAVLHEPREELEAQREHEFHLSRLISLLEGTPLHRRIG